jgi:outer membrane protein TolC
MTRVWLSIAVVVGSAGGVAHADDTLTIDQAIQLALTRNERSRITELQLVQADAGLEKARTAFFPSVSANGADTYKPLDKAPQNVINGALALDLPIFAPSAIPLYSQAKHSLAAQQAQTIEDKRQLAFDTAHAFFTVLLAQRVVEAAQKELETASADVADTDAQFKAQLVSSNDVTRAKISLAGSERDLANDKGNFDNALIALGFIVNAPPPKRLTAPTSLLEAGKKNPGTADQLVAQSLKQRPDLEAKKESALAAHDFAREPRWRALPSLAFVGQMTATSNNQPGTDHVDGVLALQASWQLFDGGARYADARSRDAAAEIADLDTRALVRSIDANVRGALAVLAAAQSALSGAQDAVDASRKSADETAILYRQGLAKAIELVDANEQRFQAEVSYAEAEYAVANAYLALRLAMGVGPLEDH